MEQLVCEREDGGSASGKINKWTRMNGWINGLDLFARDRLQTSKESGGKNTLAMCEWYKYVNEMTARISDGG